MIIPPKMPNNSTNTNKHNHSAFLISAPVSNSGKTIITLGLIKALKNRGRSVQPFKCGPDYIDTMHHTAVAEVPSYNLDTWMASSNHVKTIFHEKGSLADVSVVEGAMGLFDGAVKDEGSAASIARLLDIPVVLVVDASSMAYSVAALLFGYKNFDLSIRFAGVIFNKVSSVSHYQFLEQAAIDVELKPLGYIPNNAALKMESRHLGLMMPGEDKSWNAVEVAAELIAEHIELDALLEATHLDMVSSKPKAELQATKLKIAIAKDEAFNFMYQANIDRLMEIGEVQFFSPLHDKQLPDVDLIWLPGGYPELYLSELSENKLIHQQIVEHMLHSKAIVAECGGMMYLGAEIRSKSGEIFPMVDLFDFTTSFENMKLHLGYRNFNLKELCYFGHEFHFSTLENKDISIAEIQTNTARATKADTLIFKKNNVWASYMHLYLGEREKMEGFLDNLKKDN